MLHGVNILLGPASDRAVIREQVAGVAGQVEGVLQDGGNLLAADGLSRLEGAIVVAGDNAVVSAEGDRAGIPQIGRASCRERV